MENLGGKKEKKSRDDEKHNSFGKYLKSLF
jgi:hypothetical protein